MEEGQSLTTTQLTLQPCAAVAAAVTDAAVVAPLRVVVPREDIVYREMEMEGLGQ